MNCRHFQKQMVDAVYGTLRHSEGVLFDVHLTKCRMCKAEFESLSRALSLVERDEEIPKRLEGFWDRLEPGLDEVDRVLERRTWTGHGRLIPLFSWGVALAATLILGLLWFKGQTQDPPGSDVERQPVQQAAVPLEAPFWRMETFFDQVQPLLLAVANRTYDATGTATGFSPGQERGLAGDLAREAAEIRNSLKLDGTSGQEKLLNDIELLLMQIANLDQDSYEQGLGLVQNYLEEETILFKISLFEMRRPVG